MNRTIAWLTQAFFVISMISGVIIVFAYYPNSAYDSVQKITYIIPFGLFFRELHYFSSEIFMLFLLVHIVVELYKKEIKISALSWSYAILALMALLILLFSGFVLKADQSANGASEVAFSLMKNTPFLDNFLSLFKDTTVFYWKFFIWHIIFLPLLLSHAIYKHVKKIGVNIKYFTLALAIVMVVSIFLSMPSDIPLEVTVDKIKGPWFFWGAENLLELNLSSLYVNLILLLPFIFLILIYFTPYKRFFKILLFLWVLVYVYFSF